MDTYVLKRYNSAAQYIAMRPILDLCNKTVRIPVTCVEKRWWEQEVMDLVGARAMATAATE